jgi:capsular exopolysaccharide synthesis family protein
MSRIHEALKKAAQERTERGVGNSTEDLVELIGVESAPAPPSLKQTREQNSSLRPEVSAPLGEFDRLVAKCRKVEWHTEARYSVFADEKLNRAGAEKFRTLRSRLYQIAAARPLKRILLTSTLPEEGKTFVAMNLAQSIIRQTDRKVLLIDADLRASRLHIALGAPSGPGLSDYLRGDLDETGVIQVGQEGNLCFIPGGSQISNPSELLHSERMTALLGKLAPAFDWIIVDSPPAIAVHDASILADMCDGILFVVRSGSTDFEIAQKAAAEFQEKNLLGVVLNRVDKSETYGDYYYGYSKERSEI